MASESLYMRERGGLIVVGLEGVAVTLAGAIVVNIGHESVVIAVEVELGNLVLHAERFAQFGNKTIGGSVVVGAELYAIAVTAFQSELVISVLHTRLFVERSGEGSVDGSAGSFGHLHIFAEGESNGLSLSFRALHSNIRRQENGSTVVGNRPVEAFSGFDVDN